MGSCEQTSSDNKSEQSLLLLDKINAKSRARQILAEQHNEFSENNNLLSIKGKENGDSTADIGKRKGKRKRCGSESELPEGTAFTISGSEPKKQCGNELDQKVSDDAGKKNKSKKKKHKNKEEDLNVNETVTKTEDKIGMLKVRSDLLNNSNNSDTIENMTANIDKETNNNLKSKVESNKNDQAQNVKKTSRERRQRKKNKKSQKEHTDKDFMKIGKPSYTERAEVQRVLPYWLSHPTIIGQDLVRDGCSVAGMKCLLPELLAKLAEEGVKRFFPVQRMVIPAILAQLGAPLARLRPNDLCISACTGSGKTLAYVLPLLHALAPHRGPYGLTSPTIRALIILPTQQLATQVLQVLNLYRRCVGVLVGSAIGSASLKQEQAELVAPVDSWTLHAELDKPLYKHLVHIVVATPGRLADHLALTPGFHLTDLRFVVFDEADRLLSGDGGQWMNNIDQTIRKQQHPLYKKKISSSDTKRYTDSLLHDVVTDYTPGLGCIMDQFPDFPPEYAQRLMFSATLSCDPEQLQTVNLYEPRLYANQQTQPGLANQSNTVQKSANKKPTKMPKTVTSTITTYTGSGFVRPPGLTEQYLVVKLDIKPLMLHHLLITNRWEGKTLVFTNTTEAAHKLTKVLRFMADGAYTVAEYSSKLSGKQQRVVEKFKKGKVQVLISTDALSRGMDIAHVAVVVSYDATWCHQTHLHRAGRTARAGATGTSLTLLHHGKHVKSFKAMLAAAGPVEVEEVKVEETDLHSYEQHYMAALSQLKSSLEEEQHQMKRDTKMADAGGMTRQWKRKLSNSGNHTKRRRGQSKECK